MVKTLLWLDDVRNPFVGDWLLSYAAEYAYGNHKIVWVKNYSEFENWILKNGIPSMICFDNDLGEKMEGYDAAKLIANICVEHKLPLPEWNIQSANPVARKNINDLLISTQKFIHAS